tara:strand:+ start:398 stop:580 length:183 start_codon:yes stop_codon:yes gene_type:complete
MFVVRGIKLWNRGRRRGMEFEFEFEFEFEDNRGCRFGGIINGSSSFEEVEEVEEEPSGEL